MKKKNKKEKTYWYLITDKSPNLKTHKELEKELGFRIATKNYRTDKDGNWIYEMKISGIRSKVMTFVAMLLESKNFKPKKIQDIIPPKK